jgi:hypothetical protein
MLGCSLCVVLPGSNRRFAPKERRETIDIAHVQHGTITAPRYYKIGEGTRPSEASFISNIHVSILSV